MDEHESDTAVVPEKAVRSDMAYMPPGASLDIDMERREAYSWFKAILPPRASPDRFKNDFIDYMLDQQNPRSGVGFSLYFARRVGDNAKHLAIEERTELEANFLRISNDVVTAANLRSPTFDYHYERFRQISIEMMLRSVLEKGL